MQNQIFFVAKLPPSVPLQMGERGGINTSNPREMGDGHVLIAQSLAKSNGGLSEAKPQKRVKFLLNARENTESESVQNITWRPPITREPEKNHVQRSRFRALKKKARTVFDEGKSTYIQPPVFALE